MGRTVQAQEHAAHSAPLGETNLQHSYGHQAMLSLISALLGAFVGMTTTGCYTPLCSAISNGNLKEAQKLLSAGAKVDETCALGQTPLFLAAGDKTPDAAALLIAGGANVNVADSSGQTPLHIAAGWGTEATVAVLLKAGADISAAGPGYTPRQRAEQKDNSGAAALLREAEQAHAQGLLGKAPPAALSSQAPLERIPPLHATTLVMELKALGTVTPNLANQVTKLVLAKLDDVEGLKTVSPEDVQLMLSVERQKDALGCDDVKCMAEIGGALGTDYVIYGQVGLVGSQYNLTLTAIDAKRSMAAGRVSSLVSATEDALVQAVPAAVASLLAKIARSREAKP